ncbi:MAG: hypothetical protein HUJ89_03650 [Bacteroidales bacterium]|nr:hypothetical protein [Bacteroidales bacterium]
MKILLVYYTGTFNTRFLSNRIADMLREEGDEVDLHEIDPSKKYRIDFSPYELVGFGYPIYGFAAPRPFLRFVRHQKFPKNLKGFIYKNSGETYHDNDASSMFVLRRLRRRKVDIRNEYHFGMPYNIHFRYADDFVKEQLVYADKLARIMIYELKHGIQNMSKRYPLRPRFITWSVARLQYIAGDINSYMYRVYKDKCISCDKCIRECPMHNIYRDEKGEIRFRHHCNMCMRCSLRCPKDAIYIGFIDNWGWRVNGAYNLKKIEAMEYKPVIDENTKGFFECYYESFSKIDRRYCEIFGGEPREYHPKAKSTGMVTKLLRLLFRNKDVREQ